MASDRASLIALRDLIADTDLTLETIPDLPQNRTAHCRENLRAALALAEDHIKQQRMTPAAVMGRKGGSTTARKHGAEARRGALPPHGGSPEDAGRRQVAQANRVILINHKSV